MILQSYDRRRLVTTIPWRNMKNEQSTFWKYWVTFWKKCEILIASNSCYIFSLHSFENLELSEYCRLLKSESHSISYQVWNLLHIWNPNVNLFEHISNQVWNLMHIWNPSGNLFQQISYQVWNLMYIWNQKANLSQQISLQVWKLMHIWKQKANLCQQISIRLESWCIFKIKTWISSNRFPNKITNAYSL